MSMCISECLCVYLNFRVYIFFFFQYFSIFHSLCGSLSLSLSLSLLFSFFLFVSLSITRWLHHVATITITSEDFFSLTFLSFLLIVPDLGSRSGGRSVGRAVTSDSRGPRFESSHQQKFILSIYCQLYWKDENKEKEAGNGPLKQEKLWILCKRSCLFY